jgi:DNA (cytosine-5)-methyltransferase 1
MTHIRQFGGNVTPTVFDQFCGAGGSSAGAARRGLRVMYAVNHWQLAVESHSANFPDTFHDCADVGKVDPARYGRTDVLITSPECTSHSLASGKKREAQADLFGNVQFDPAAERSRATAWDVVRFAEVHRYNAIIVENVVDFRKWRLFPEWLRALQKLGYEWQVVYINAMFAHMRPNVGLAVGDFVPQSRDRMFVVLWRKGLPRPDLDFRPLAPCQHCGVEVEAVQSWKKPGNRWGRWGERGQYLYRCPACTNAVTPYYYAAANVIDWRLPMQRIGDRQRPLKPRTMERIQAGLNKFWDAFTVDLSHTHGADPRVRHAGSALHTQTATQSVGLVISPFVVYTDHGDNSHPAREITRELPAQTARQNLGVVVPAIVSMRDANRNHYQVQLVEGPLPTQVAAGIQQWLLATPAVVAMRNVDGADHFKTTGAEQPLSTQVTAIQHGLLVVPFLAQLRNHQTAIGVDEPLGTVIAGGVHHALVMSYYSHSVPQPVEEALPTVTTVDRHSLIVSPQRPALEDCLFRMLTAAECKLAQSFPRDYVILGSQRDQVRQIGNANPPVLMDALLARVAPIVQ